VPIPVACTLSAGGAERRLDEWRHFVATSTISSERPGSQQFRVQLADGAGVLDAAVDLARREKACCAFFDFAIDVAADQLWLRVSVPPEATGILDDFAALLVPSA
jgi:hypothetical protein